MADLDVQIENAQLPEDFSSPYRAVRQPDELHNFRQQQEQPPSTTGRRSVGSRSDGGRSRRSKATSSRKSRYLTVF